MNNIPERLLELENRLIEKFHTRPYIEPVFRIDSSSKPYSISWYMSDINDQHIFYGDDPEALFQRVEAYIDSLDPEAEALVEFTKKLGSLIEEAPGSIDVSPLAEFKADIQSILIPQ